MIDILAMGEPMVEFTATGGQYLQGFGGDTSNAAVAAARSGASAGYLTRLGKDAFGDKLMAMWAAERVDTAGVSRDPAAPTAIYFIEPTQAGKGFVYYRAGSAASRMRPDTLPDRVIEDARILHVSGISQAIGDGPADAVFAAIERARAAGREVSYDTNLRLNLWPVARARAVIHEAMRRATIALPGEEDAEALTGLTDRDAMVDFYLGLGPRVVALKCGADGALVATAGERRMVPAFAVEPLDTSGAGDCFCGAFLARLAHGDDPFSAARWANAAAALSTLGAGAVAPIPTAAETAAFLAERS